MGLLALLVRRVCQQILNLIVKIEMKNAWLGKIVLINCISKGLPVHQDRMQKTEEMDQLDHPAHQVYNNTSNLLIYCRWHVRDNSFSYLKGQPGTAGQNGKDGVDGKDGQDGAPGPPGT
jgi:hypothetical protein